MANTVTTDSTDRWVIKQGIAYPVIAKQKEFMVVSLQYSAQLDGNSQFWQQGIKSYLPDIGTILWASCMLEIWNANTGETLSGAIVSQLKLDEIPLLNAAFDAYRASTVGERGYSVKTIHFPGLYIPVNDDNFLSQYAMAETHANFIHSVVANWLIGLAKQD